MELPGFEGMPTDLFLKWLCPGRVELVAVAKVPPIPKTPPVSSFVPNDCTR